MLIENEGKTIKQAYDNLKELFSKDEFIDLLIQMEDAAVLNGIKSSNNNCNFNSKLSSLTLMVIQECNMRCKYCYGDGGEYNEKGKMNKNTAVKAIDFLINKSNEKELLILKLYLRLDEDDKRYIFNNV